MELRIILRIFSVIVLATLVPSILGPRSQPTPGALQVSYNPPPADVFHAPLSDMALLAYAQAQLNSSGAAPLLVGSSSGSPGSGQNDNQNGQNNGPETTRQRALRFVNDTSYFPQTETSIAVDPINPNHLVGGFNDMRFIFCPALPSDCYASSFPASLSGFTVSADGGVSLLKGSNLPELNVSSNLPLMVPYGDPTLAPGDDGNFFYASLALGPYGRNGIVVAKSNPALFSPRVSCVTSTFSPTENACWSSVFVYGSTVLFPYTLEDKPVIAVDQSKGSFAGSVYVAWDHFDQFEGTSVSYMARCDRDLTSCTMLAGGTDKLPLSGADQFASFTTPAVDGNGNVYVTWCNYGTFRTFGPVTCRVRWSSPGGSSFGQPATIMSFMGSGTTLPDYSFTQGFATEQFRTASIPFLAVDTSPKETFGNLYFTIQVCTSGRYIALHSRFLARDNPGNCGLSGILFSRSSDKGATWSSPVVISQPAVNAQPSIAVDPVTGNLFVVYYTTQYDQFNHRIDVVAARSIDGGASFHQIRVTSVSNEPDSNPNMYFYLSNFGGSWTTPEYGDYFQAAVYGGTLWVLFTANYAVEHGTFQTDPFLATLKQ